MNASPLDTLIQQEEHLSYSDKAILMEKLHEWIGTDTSVPHPALRVAGLHAGKGWMADNFDAPLPDSFWLGEDEV
jgi:hypothetical protein